MQAVHEYMALAYNPPPSRRHAIAVMASVAAGSCTANRKLSEGVAVRLAVTRSSLIFLPVYVAGPLGCFHEEKVRVEMDEVVSVSRSAQALLGGSADVACGSVLRVLMLAAEGRRLKAFVTMQSQPGFVAAVSPRASKPIRRIEDLKGTKVGTSSPGSDYHLVLNHVIAAHGLGPQDIQVIGVGTGAAHATALEQGLIDVGLIAGTTIPILEKRHPGMKHLFDTRTREGTRAQVGADEFPTLLYARSEWLDQNAETVARMARAIRRATAWIKTHSPAEVREKLPESCRTEPYADIEAIRFTSQMLTDDGRITPEAVKAAFNILTTTNGKWPSNAAGPDQSYTNQYLS